MASAELKSVAFGMFASSHTSRQAANAGVADTNKQRLAASVTVSA
jgi:hypothetical protein